MSTWLPTARTPLAEAAAIYSAHGWPVLPLAERGKVPLAAHGLLDATTDPSVVAEAWRRHQRANIGVRVPVGMVIVDVDGPAGVQSLRGAPGLRTLTARTARGWHLWYRAPEGVQLRQGAAFLPGVDSRTAGRGYVVAPPSVHETGVVYEWVRAIELAPLPGWLVDLLAVHSPPSTRQASASVVQVADAYARSVLSGEANAVATTGEGGRNCRLYAAWRRCQDAEVAPHLPLDLVRDTLTRAALAAGLGHAEIARTLREEAAA